MINGESQDLDPVSVQLIREAYNELMEEMASSEIDVESIKKLMSSEDTSSKIDKDWALLWTKQFIL